MATVSTGNIYEDLIQNVVNLISNNRLQFNPDIKKVYDADLSIIPVFPCVTVELDYSGPEEWAEMGSGSNPKRIPITLAITYYHSELDERTRRKDVRKALEKLADILRQNWNINNFCSRWGSTIDSVTPYAIRTPADQIIAGGRVMITCYVEETVTIR